MAEVHFSLSGDTLTDLCRQFVLEDRWNHALKTLLTGLGCSVDIANKILLGEWRLTGDEYGMEVEDEDPTEAAKHRAAVNRLYAGRRILRERGGREQWIRPSASVDNYGPDDKNGADCSWGVERPIRYGVVFVKSNPLVDCLGSIPTRATYYADADEMCVGVAKVKGHDYPVAVLFRTCPPAPEILSLDRVITSPESIQEAVTEWENVGGHRLENRGWMQTFDGDSEAMDRAKEVAREISRHHAKQLAGEAIETARKVAKADKNPMRGSERAEVMTDMILDESQRTTVETPNPIDRWTEKANAQIDQILQGEYSEDSIEATLPEWRDLIWKLNGDNDYLVLPVVEKEGEPPVVYRVARKPFINWCLWRTTASHLMPSWHAVCPSGVKRGGCADDPLHSDWVVSAYRMEKGKQVFADLETWEWGYADPIQKASGDLHSRIQHEMCGFKCSVLSGGGGTYGEVTHPGPDEKVSPDKIAVIPYAKPEYLAAAMTAKAVITGEGGEMCHMVQISRSSGFLVIRVPDCLTRFPEGGTVKIDAANGTVEIQAIPVRGLLG